MPQLVRIKPFNARKGNLTRSYTYKGLLFKEEAGWHEVDDAVADYLKTATTDGNADSPLVFDVAGDEDEATDIEEKACKAATRATADKPHRMSFVTDQPHKPTGSSGDLTLEEVNPRAARADARKEPLTTDPAAKNGGVVDKTGDAQHPQDLDDEEEDEEAEKRQAALTASEAAKRANEKSSEATKDAGKVPATPAPAATVEIPGAPKKSGK